MLFDRLSKQIKEYPKLNEVYQAMIRKEYFITNITTTANSEEYFDFTSIEVGMENKEGERILLTFSEGIVNSMTVKKVPSINEKIHPKILLNKWIIHNQSFKNNVFGGYNRDEVNNFLDLIVKDYKYIEDVLIKENKMLKEDIEKLKGR